jgi:hypothetical protein
LTVIWELCAIQLQSWLRGLPAMEMGCQWLLQVQKCLHVLWLAFRCKFTLNKQHIENMRMRALVIDCYLPPWSESDKTKIKNNAGEFPEEASDTHLALSTERRCWSEQSHPPALEDRLKWSDLYSGGCIFKVFDCINISVSSATMLLSILYLW